MRIGIITHNYADKNQGTDAGSVVWDIARRLSKHVPVYVLTSTQSSGRMSDPVPVTSISHTEKRKFGTLSVVDPRSLLSFSILMKNGTREGIQWATDNHIDILLAMWAIPGGLIAENIHKKLHIPYAVFSLGSDIHTYSRIPILSGMIKNCLTHARFRFANSEVLALRIKQWTRMPCTLIRTATTIPPAEDIKPMQFDPSVYHFLYVGRLERIKGVDTLISAARRLKNQRNRFRIHNIGDGTLRPALQKEIAAYGLSDTIQIPGVRKNTDVWRYMRGSDCLIIPSRNESMPLVIAEAAHLGLPVITTDVGDAGMTVHRYNAGLVVPPGNPQALALAMETMRGFGKKTKNRFRKGLRALTKDFRPNIAPNMILDLWNGCYNK